MATFWENLRAITTKSKEKWSSLSLNQKVLILGALVLVIAAITVSTINITDKDYQPLYSKMDINDAAEVKAKLDELGIPYKLSDEGTTILVPADEKYQARLQLASAGLPKGTEGFELFDETNFGETETDKKIKYERALKGELTRTIQSLNKVESASVNLVIPEKTLFSESEQPATASVLIKVKPGKELEKKEVLAIVHLVASAVEGLKPENVTIVDSEGRLLSANLAAEESPENDIELTQIQMAMKKKFEQDLQESVQSMLEQTYGPRKAIVRVAAELNFDKKETTMERYGPTVLPRSMYTLEESSVTTETTPEGIPGTATNIPIYEEAATGETKTQSEKSEKTVNNEIDKEVTSVEFAQGEVKSLTVSVIIDKDLDEQERDNIRLAVENAVGIDRTNPEANVNRSVSVVGIKFTQPAPAEPPVSTIGQIINNYGWLISLLLVILAGLLVWLVMRKRRQQREAELEEAAGFETVVGEDIELVDLMERELTPEEKEQRKIRAEIQNLIDKNGEDAANVLRMWLMEEAR